MPHRLSVPTHKMAGPPPAPLASNVPVPLAAVIPHMKGTPKEVWITLLKARHGTERHTPSEWLAFIDKYGHEPT
ncbi:MAG: hypothetical protein KGJ90_00475 [Patescibacteria group bacterium]|nr:hypothetical protein [Patescibacteria group bacterium]